jgi:hypothetical protein
MPHLFLCASRPLIISTHTAKTHRVLESGWCTCDLFDGSRPANGDGGEPPTGAYYPGPKGIGKDDPEATGVYDWRREASEAWCDERVTGS